MCCPLISVFRSCISSAILPPLASVLTDYHLLIHLSPFFKSLLGISRREAANCHRIRHFENTFVVETVICQKSWNHSPDVTFLGFACTHMHTHALSPLFRHGNLATFYTPPSLCSSNLWGPLWPFLPCYLPKTFSGLKFTQCSKITGGRCSFFHTTG